MYLPHKGLLAVLLATWLISGCGPSYTYRYSPPPSAHGMNCINNCSSERRHCQQLGRLEENSQRALYQAEMRAYQYCKTGKSKKEARHNCYQPSYPFGSSSSYSCGRDYDSCYMACGGTIQRIRNPD
ncbi:hypothetical protein IAE40_04940 [Pseudomonas sp. S44]|uniref:hypothetical protein n=1 Tax=Pseudomonas sp. S44 TaxID=2767450 RepID=UPI00190B82BC|nr:hypothetical protein [Pseudomonas sp. S44]MBK0057969.1 hypothetical protein [Pseudomonas sp. S44]